MLKLQRRLSLRSLASCALGCGALHAYLVARSAEASTPLNAFSTTEGFGAEAAGGRAETAIEVTNLEDFRKPLYEMIQERTGVVPDQSLEEFTAVTADKRLAGLLEVPVGAALLRRERTVLDTGRKPVEFAVVHYRCDRFRLTLSLRQE